MKVKQLYELVKLIEQSSIDEIEVREWFGQRIRIRKNVGSAVSVATAVAPPAPVLPTPPVAAPAQKGPEPSAAKQEDESRYFQVRAPMVGTFYRAPAPDAEPFVKEGDIVAKGQTLCIIEAMKLMNEIESEVAGRIVKILAANAQPIEYNQVLFLIDPS
ncbi:MAG: acetyl-CoA carboxylase biotin carboxyl carrier protein [candidate division KSB1 bacterium]|nr:acetyl-CoA carboxylase biotin carboxyl carrier protein [candidate division KSB1 bacterium]